MLSQRLLMCLRDYQNIVINDDAIFVADSHTQGNRDALIYKLKSLSLPSQIFFLGDIANILIGNLAKSVESNKNLINMLEELSCRTQVIYFEGNHDFNLYPLLPNAIKIPRKFQPILATFKNQKVLLAHGDLFLEKKYEYYIRCLTSKYASLVMNTLDFITFGRLYDLIENKVSKKQIFIINDATTLINRRILAYKQYIQNLNIKVDMVIEGHFHIGKMQKDDFLYVALPSFYVNGAVFKIGEDRFVGL